MQVLVIGKISNAVVLAGAAYQDEAGYARMTGLPRDKTRLLDDKGRTDTQVWPVGPDWLQTPARLGSAVAYVAIFTTPVALFESCRIACDNDPAHDTQAASLEEGSATGLFHVR